MILFRTRQVGVVVAALAFSVTPAHAQTNSVFIESKTVLPGQTDVKVGVYVSNAVPVTALIFAFEFRTLGSLDTSYSYFVGPTVRGWNPLGRAYISDLGPEPVPSGEPAQIQNRWYPVPGGTTCSGPLASTYQTSNETPDGISPDGCLFTAISMGCENCSDDYQLEIGTEIAGIDIPSFLIQFDANQVLGQFEIDTCCVRPANHTMYVDRNTNIVPVTFTKGVITIDCDCACLGDPNCDSETDVIDLVETINVAFRGMAGVTDSDCMLSRTDLNASGATDIVDVTLMVRAVFRGEPIETIVTNPCL
jgi:hypothetical protein